MKPTDITGVHQAHRDDAQEALSGPMGPYIERIGTWLDAWTHESVVEQHWPFTDKVIYNGSMVRCNLKTGEDPDPHGMCGMGPRLMGMTKDQLIIEIYKHLLEAMHYLLVYEPRINRVHQDWQHREVCRLVELFYHRSSMCSTRVSPKELKDMEAQELRAILEIISDTFENLC